MSLGGLLTIASLDGSINRSLLFVQAVQVAGKNIDGVKKKAGFPRPYE
jgi:hypothetical protein